MILYDFEYERPGTLEEAASILDDLTGGGRLMAGGTDLLPNTRIEIAKPAVLVSLSGIAPRDPERLPDGTIRIDALSRLSDLESSPFLHGALPMLAEAAHTVASNQIRQMGTLGGNLCQETRCLYLNQQHDYQFVAPCYKRGGDCCYPFPNNKRNVCWSVYMSDTAPVLIALDAAVEIVNRNGVRRMPLERLFTGDGLDPLTIARSDIVRAVLVPPVGPSFGWGYHKSTVRGGLEFATAIIAVTLRLDGDGKTCSDARIVFGAIDEGPVRAVETEKTLIGAPLDKAKLAQAAKEASREIRPLPHHGFTKRHLHENIRINLQRTFLRALDRARGARS